MESAFGAVVPVPNCNSADCDATNWELPKKKASFIAPMLLLRQESLPDGPEWLYEIKLDGYRAVAFKANNKVLLRSRNDNDFTNRYPAIAKALANLPDDTVIDGEIVALGADNKPSFNLLQNYGSSEAPLLYYVFDVMIAAGRDVMGQPLRERRDLLESAVLKGLSDPVRLSPELNASVADLIASVKIQGFEGLVAKRRDAKYESGLRSGAWLKMRVNAEQEFVIAGYTPSDKNFDAMILGYYEGSKLMYAARTRNGFTPASRADLFKKFHGLGVRNCPFANLPEAKSGRWGAGLTAAKMKECKWLRPLLVGQFEFVEWTADGHLRHSKFVALREDKMAKDVIREGMKT